MSMADLEKLVSRLEAVTGRLEAIPKGGGGGGSAAAIDDTPDWYEDYVKIHDEAWLKFVKDSTLIGGDVSKQAGLVKVVFDAHKILLGVAARCNTPSPTDLQALLKPLSDGIIAVQNFRETNRPSKQFNFLSAISEGIPFLGWVAIAPKPAAYITQMEESSQFYTNKILKEFRQSEPSLADWSNSWIKLLKTFKDYVKDSHSIGLVWNKEKPAATATSAKVGAASPGGAPPPPGPPPPMAPPPVSGKPAVPSKPNSSALFAELSKGSDVTKGLKKISDDMKTHKNPALRQVTGAAALSPRPYSPPQFKKFTPPSGGPAKPTKKPPVFELQNKKWVVEWQENNQKLVIDEPSPEQTVYMFKCTNSVLQVKGKLNSITLDSCKKCAVVFEDLISTCEFINCQSVKAQANGNVPTISIDKTDGAQIYVNDKSIKAEIISAKSSEMNICITKQDGDLTEFALAEQFKTVWNGKGFSTVPMDLNL